MSGASDLADAIPHIVWTQDADGTVTYFNQRWEEYTGLHRSARGPETEGVVHPEDRDAVTRAFAEGRRTNSAVDVSYRLRRHDGAYRWHRGHMVPLERRADGSVASWVGTATDIHLRRRLADEHRFLAAAGRVLGTSLDLQQTLNDVAKLVVPDLADWCAIDIVRDDGTLERPAVAHADPAKVDLAWKLWERTKPLPSDTTGVYQVIRSRQPEHHREITDELLVAAIPDQELLALMRGLGLRSSMCVPLIGREHVLGALTLVSAESRHLYEEHDLAFANDFAGRIAIAIENARLYRHATEARAAAEAMAAEVIEQSRTVEEALLAMRRERDQALAEARRQK